MSDTIIVALLSLAGTIIGSLLGVVASSKLTSYRLEQLEKKQDKHNQVIERVFLLEKNDAVVKEELQTINRRIDGLEHCKGAS